jgi:hypothetical protein
MASSDHDGGEADALKLEIDGPGVHPSTVDPLVTLELGATYLRLLKAVASELSVELELEGLDIEDKCAALVFHSNQIDRAQLVANSTHQMLTDLEPAPPRALGPLNRFRESLRAVPSGQTISVLFGSTRLSIPREVEAPQETPRESTTLRSTLIAVGGKQPTAKFISKSEGERAFTLQVLDVPTAQLLGKHLFEEMDIDVIVGRDEQGRISSGELIEFSPLTNGEPLESWRNWFNAVGSGWNSVDELEEALRQEDFEEFRGQDA